MKCGWIENRLSIETDGFTRPCCLETNENARISHINDGILNNFTHPILLKLRENLKNGFSPETRNFCNRCEDLEKNNQASLRTDTGITNTKRELNYLQLKLSNQCQLACAHCGSGRSSTWAKINGDLPHVKKGFTITTEFIDELKKLLPQIKVLKFSGGEPFLQPDHWTILELLNSEKREHCELHYITNGISPIQPKLWEGWKSVQCSISVDGFEDSYEWFRRGSTWSLLMEHLEKIKQHSSISINYSITPYTVSDFLRAQDFWSKKYNFSYFPIVFPDHCNMLNFPKKYITQLPNYEKIPHTNSCSDTSDITLFRKWAISSDLKWNTIGQANKLFWWM